MGEQYQVVITPRAAASLEDIVRYLAQNASVETAEKARKKLLAAMNTLSKIPTAHPMLQGIVSKKNITYRRILAMSYRIVYTIKEAELQVLVVEIHHSKRSPRTINKSLD